MLYDVIRSILNGYPVVFLDVLMRILAVLFIIFCILPLHELAHAWVGYKLGDVSMRNSGRLSLNPLASIDPMGALFLLLFGFGWAQPVSVDTRYLKNPKRDMAIVALAGPLSNVLAAVVGGFFYWGIGAATQFQVPTFILSFFEYFIYINVGIAAFNLIPLPPLDGSKILAAFLSDKLLYNYYRYQNVIAMVSMLLLFTGRLDRPIAFLMNILLNATLWVSHFPFQLFGLL